MKMFHPQRGCDPQVDKPCSKSIFIALAFSEVCSTWTVLAKTSPCRCRALETVARLFSLHYGPARALSATFPTFPDFCSASHKKSLTEHTMETLTGSSMIGLGFPFFFPFLLSHLSLFFLQFSVFETESDGIQA